VREKEGPEKIRILIVDDMVFTRNFISNCAKLSFPGSICDTAADGKTALEKLQAQSYSIILCDWEMPGIKGDEILRWVRGAPETKALPFIMVTANDEKESIMNVISLGVTDYVVKPLNCETLSQKIRSALKLK